MAAGNLRTIRCSRCGHVYAGPGARSGIDVTLGSRMTWAAFFGALRSPGQTEHPPPLAPVALWLIYSFAALWVLPVSNHDALSYHFTKSAWLAITGKFALYPVAGSPL